MCNVSWVYCFVQADKEKKKKKKSVKEEAAAEAPAEAPAGAAPDRASRGSKKAAKRTGSNVFSMFSQKQVAEFKEVLILPTWRSRCISLRGCLYLKSTFTGR